MTDRHSFTRRPDCSGDFETALDPHYRMPRSTLVATFRTRKPRLPLTNDRQGAPNIPCALSAAHDRDGSISSFRKVSIAQFPPGHLALIKFSILGGIMKWSHNRQTSEIWPG